MSNQIYFNHTINTPDGGFTAVFYFDARDWFEGEGQIPELRYWPMHYSPRQQSFIETCLESLNSDDNTLIYAMQEAADKFKHQLDWEKALDYGI